MMTTFEDVVENNDFCSPDLKDAHYRRRCPGGRRNGNNFIVCYKMVFVFGARNENYFVFEATSTNTASADFNVIACVDLKTGASHQIIGRNGAVAETSSLTCLGSR